MMPAPRQRDLFGYGGEAPAASPEDPRDKGFACQTCAQWVQRYRVAIERRMALQLVYFYHRDNEDPGAWIHHRDAEARVPNSRKYSYLRFWGLLEPSEVTSGLNGYWRITRSGREFVEGRARIPRHVYMYNGESEGPVDPYDRIAIQDSLKQSFEGPRRWAERLKEMYARMRKGREVGAA